MLVVILITLVAPGAALAQDVVDGSTPGEVQRPAAAIPLQLGETFQLEPGAAVTSAESVTAVEAGQGPMVTDPPPDAGAEGAFTLADASGLTPDSWNSDDTPALIPSAVEACTPYIQNGSFTTTAAWGRQPTANVQYSPYGWDDQRSVYMTTSGRQSGWLWQRINVPAQTGSLYVRFKTWQRLDAGETAWVSVWDANFTKRLWWRQLEMTQNTWMNWEAWVTPIESLRGQTVILAFEAHPEDQDQYRSELGFDVVEFTGCSTPTPTISNDPKYIDLTISVYRNVIPNSADETAYKQIVWYAADAIYEMSEGRHYLRNVTFFLNKLNWNTAHVQWDWCNHPNADAGYYRYPHLGQIRMGDLFMDKTKPNPCGQPLYNHLQRVQQAGYTLAHELGHYFYMLYDEYRAPSGDYSATDISINYSVMSSQHCALPNYDEPHCLAKAYELDWLNFSHVGNFNVRNPNHTKNYQFRYYLSNAWDTLVRHPKDDRGWSQTVAKIQRQFFPELASVAPKANSKPTYQLPGGTAHSNAAGLVKFTWKSPLANEIAEETYLAQVFAPSGNTVTYPEAALIMASVDKDGVIARATLSAQVTEPDGSKRILQLKDDGIAPDELRDDGRYSGILSYRQNGSYTVNATFTNPSNTAVYTDVGKEDIAWVLGQAVGENFSATAGATLVVTGYTGDDHADTLNQATILYTDNVPKPGQIDRAGDSDTFSSTLNGDGSFVLRLSSFAEGMRPTIRLWHPNGQEILNEWTIEPKPGYYYFIRLTGVLGNSFYTEILHADPNADKGMYALSFGRPLPNEESLEPFELFLPMLAR